MIQGEQIFADKQPDFNIQVLKHWKFLKKKLINFWPQPGANFLYLKKSDLKKSN